MKSKSSVKNIWKNKGNSLIAHPRLMLFAHDVLQKQWSTSASKPFKKVDFAENSEFVLVSSMRPSNLFSD